MNYLGRKNYNHWNVACWILNDENYYLLALKAQKKSSLSKGALYLLNNLPDKTPDGVKFTISSLKAVLSSL